jgi:hypothetical protein
VRITDAEGKPLASVYLALSDKEARELSDALSELTSAPKGWHAHVSDDAYQREVTVYRDDDTVADIANPS